MLTILKSNTRDPSTYSNNHASGSHNHKNITTKPCGTHKPIPLRAVGLLAENN